jgi:hypothetical protein
VHRGVGAPRAPGLRAALHLARGQRPAAHRQCAPQAEVARREGVRLAAGAHRHHLRRPLADAGDLAEPGSELEGPARGVEIQGAVRHGARKRPERGGARER